VGVGILISSILSAYFVLRIRVLIYGVRVDDLIEAYKKEQPYETVLKRTAFTMMGSLGPTLHENNRKARLLMGAWFLLIIGLIVIMTFVTLSIYMTTPNPS
jgi:hypothetical protein